MILIVSVKSAYYISKSFNAETMLKTFPEGFKWGSATSAYQIEGAHDVDGKGPSIWDHFSHQDGNIKNNDNGDIGIDHYNRFKEDVALMKAQGYHVYRFSVSWPRIMPNGKGEINEKGIEFYSALIDELLANGIEPWVTLYHWDLPQVLEEEIDGWLNPEIADCFADYARICFERFGDRVKHWITHNEPWVVSVLGYGQGIFAPGIKSNEAPYQASHNLLIAHAKAVQVYRTEFGDQNGQIGITNNCDWREPLTDKQEDRNAAQRALEFFLGWYADPVYKGDYPQIMKDMLGSKLPAFSEEEKIMLKGSSDFFGLNHYTTMYASNDKGASQGDIKGNGGINDDQKVALTRDDNWELTAMEWAVVPWGCRKLLEWIAERYDNPPIYITENGFACDDEFKDGVVDDTETRLKYYNGYLCACHKAIEKGVNLKGYFAWSLFDNFEWAHGYGSRFGLNYVDYTTMVRTPKASALWFADVIKKNAVESI